MHLCIKEIARGYWGIAGGIHIQATLCGYHCHLKIPPVR
jgi:hypothetical protein